MLYQEFRFDDKLDGIVHPHTALGTKFLSVARCDNPLAPIGRIDARQPDFLHVSRRSCGALSSPPSTRISGCPSAGRQREGSDPSEHDRTAIWHREWRRRRAAALMSSTGVVLHGPPSRSSSLSATSGASRIC